jgi:hypothetical protein
MKQPGLDRRHRDQDGQISRKHGNTRIGSLRKKMGPDFAVGINGNTKLSTVLEELDKPSLSQLVKSLKKK